MAIIEENTRMATALATAPAGASDGGNASIPTSDGNATIA